MGFQAFNEDYIRRLVQGDRPVQDHFVAYFSDRLHIKLRRLLRSSDTINEIQHETFKRVLKALRTGRCIGQPERLGFYVNAVCNSVVLETIRNGRADMDAPLIHHRLRRLVEQALTVLSKRDEKLLRRFRERR